jgi:hypothetical protein
MDRSRATLTWATKVNKLARQTLFTAKSPDRSALVPALSGKRHGELIIRGPMEQAKR